MKKNKAYSLIVFLILVTFLAASSASAQSNSCDCYGNGGYSCEVTVSGIADIAAIAQDNCTTISGHLIINSANLTDLNGLQNIENINYDLTIYNNLLLTNLDGLTNLTRVGFNLNIIQNDVLASISGLDNLITVSGDSIDISWNPALDDLTPLYGTNVPGNYLVIQNNQTLSMENAFNLLIQLSPPNGIFNGSSLITNNGILDSDNDGIEDAVDNCPDNCNSQQLDADSDGIGDVCDSNPKCGATGACGQPECEIEC